MGGVNYVVAFVLWGVCGVFGVVCGLVVAWVFLFVCLFVLWDGK